MNKTCLISNFCSISENKIIVGNNTIPVRSGDSFRELMNELYSTLGISYPKFHKMDNLSKLGFISTELVLRGRDLNHKYSGDEVGIVFMNSSSSLDTDRQHQSTLSDRENYFPSPSIFVYTLPNVVIGEICIRHKFSGEGNFIISEKFNPELLVTCIEMMFKSETIQCCIGGWVELNGNDFESMLFLIERPDGTQEGIANFEPDYIRSLYEKIRR